MPVIPALWSLRQEDHKVTTSLGNTVRSCALHLLERTVIQGT